MDIRQTVHITLADQAPKIIDGYWHEWVDGKWINTGVKAEGDDAVPPIIIDGYWAFWNKAQNKYIKSEFSAIGDDGHSPKIVDGYWHEWDPTANPPDYRNTGIKAEGKDGTNYLIMGFFSDKVQYKLSPAGIPVVKRPDGSQGNFSVFELTAPQSTFDLTTNKGIFVPSEWKLVESADFIYMQEAYIEHLQALTVTAKKVRTSVNGARTEIDSEGIKVFNALENMNIRFGLKNGYAVMEYYDNDGNFLYDLGPSGISKVEVREEKWVEVKLVYLGDSFSNVLTDNQIKTKYKTPGLQNETTYYRYVSKVVAGQNQDLANDGKIFKNSNKASGYITAGVYMHKTVGMQKEMLTEGTGARIYPPGIQPENEGVLDKSPLYFVELLHYSGGVISSTANAYWNPGLPSMQL